MVGIDLRPSIIATGGTVMKSSRRRSQLVHPLALLLVVGLVVPGSRSIAASFRIPGKRRTRLQAVTAEVATGAIERARWVERLGGIPGSDRLG